MGTLQVSNVHLESTANNRIEYAGSNTVNIYAGGTLMIGSSATTVSLSNLPTYADNSAAISGGLSAGNLYKTAGGDIKIVV
tara:strand:- start:55463 stop:55705 length:243 start_codon:yes stop_codon:yes gene_type:complete